MPDWWQTFFDGADYLRLWETRSQTPDKTEREVASLWAVLGLSSREDIVQVKLILTDMALPAGARVMMEVVALFPE